MNGEGTINSKEKLLVFVAGFFFFLFVCFNFIVVVAGFLCFFLIWFGLGFLWFFFVVVVAGYILLLLLQQTDPGT